MSGLEGNSEYCFSPRISMFPSTSSRETFRFEGNKIYCSPRDQSLSDLLCSKTKQKQILKNALTFQRQHQVNSDHVHLLFQVIVFAMLPHGIWQETVSLSCDHELAYEWARCSRKINKRPDGMQRNEIAENSRG